MNNIETVGTRTGKKVHYRLINSVTTFCGQGMSTRGYRTSGLFRVNRPVNCGTCISTTKEGK